MRCQPATENVSRHQLRLSCGLLLPCWARCSLVKRTEAQV